MNVNPVREQFERDLQMLEELGVELKYVLDTYIHADNIIVVGLFRQAIGVKIVFGEPAGGSMLRYTSPRRRSSAIWEALDQVNLDTVANQCLHLLLLKRHAFHQRCPAHTWVRENGFSTKRPWTAF